ncbi:magnesium/cobalt transporter CorA [Prescottella subtropica]|uniref:magnesium/cobalt transporter CorA n=1 Tax=Prescottella subtropica TaxID=2545757 RepID=UPI0010F4E2E5|nr:magnesium/cobalt transporter CorA [Prescottella subtropica]
MSIVDSAVYVDGVRVDTPATPEGTFATMNRRDGMAWIGLYRPDTVEIESLAEEFGLHHLAVEDTIVAHQRPKLERYDDILFVVLRPARYLDAVEKVEFGEVHVFVGPDFVVTVRHAESPDLAQVRRRLEGNPDLLRRGPESVLYAILDQVVDEYFPVTAGLENDIDEIENQMFTGDPAVAKRIYDLSGEVIDFQRATHPLVAMIEALERGSDKYHVDLELQRHLRDALDHTLRIIERVDSSRDHLQTALSVHATLVAQRQNEEMRRLTLTSLDQSEEVKKISSWAAILFAPTLVGGIYGMNFDAMPELAWQFGYPVAIGLMIVTSVTLYIVFKRQHWL